MSALSRFEEIEQKILLRRLIKYRLKCLRNEIREIKMIVVIMPLVLALAIWASFNAEIWEGETFRQGIFVGLTIALGVIYGFYLANAKDWIVNINKEIAKLETHLKKLEDELEVGESG